MQGPLPPPGLDPNLVFNEVVPIFAAVVVIVAVAVALRWIFRTPVGEAIADRIRTRAQRRWGAGATIPSGWRRWKLRYRISRGRSPSSPSA